MKLYSENDNYKLYSGSMLDMLEVIPEESVDSIITDPPYELNFMGKGWDNSGIAFQPDTWKQCYEVLKPGGYLLAFGGSRTFHRIACAIEDAGFEIRDTIMWLYGSGFPKSMNISKQIDKMPNRSRKNMIRIGEIIKENRNKNNLTQRQLGELIGVSRELINLYEIKGNNQQQIPTQEQWLKIKEVLRLNDEYDYIFIEAEREVIGKSNYSIPSKIYDIANGSGERLEQNITIPSTDLAKQWQGWGTALKPSFEPIIVARKPFKGSLVDNVIEYGVGGLNIDECRVENTSADTYDLEKRQNSNASIVYNDGRFLDGLHKVECKHGVTEQGRFPANTILTYDETDFDEVCGGFPNTKPAGNKIGQDVNKNLNYNASSYKLSNNKCPKIPGDNGGSASRYFYCAKASKKDRDEGLNIEIEEYVLKDNVPEDIKDKILNSLTS